MKNVLVLSNLLGSFDILYPVLVLPLKNGELSFPTLCLLTMTISEDQYLYYTKFYSLPWFPYLNKIWWYLSK